MNKNKSTKPKKQKVDEGLEKSKYPEIPDNEFNPSKDIMLNCRHKQCEKNLILEDILNTQFQFNKKFKNNSEAIKKLRRQKKLIKEPSNNKCFFIEGNKGYVSRENNSGIIKYYSISPTNNQDLDLNIIDIYILLTGKKFEDAINDLFIIYKIETQEEEWKRLQQNIIKECIVKIEYLDNLKNEYPVLYTRIKSGVMTLLALYYIGIENIKDRRQEFDDKAIFSVSAEQIRNFIINEFKINNPDSVPYINKSINYLSLLGFINKHHIEEVPYHMRIPALENAKKHKREPMSFYTINKITPKLLDCAEEISKKLKDYKICISKITYENIEEYFGSQIANMVYPNKNNKRYNEEKDELIEDELNKEVINILIEYVDGMNNRTAKKIVNKYEEQTFNIIVNDYQSLLAIKGITEESASKIHQQLVKHKILFETINKITNFGIRISQVNKVYKIFGNELEGKIKDNPYVLCDYTDIDFKSIDKLAKELGFISTEMERIKHGIMLYISKSIKNCGNIYIYKEEILNNLNGFLKQYGAFGDDIVICKEIRPAIEELVLQKKIVIEENNDSEECIYITFYRHMEDEVVRIIKDMSENCVEISYFEHNIEKIIEEDEKKLGFALSNKQKEAIYMALNSKISIICGGPGTGKTQIINSIINCINKYNSDAKIELCAPTGRAAKRLEEITEKRAKTIHRLIGLNNFIKDNNKVIRINSSFVIVDEMSMVDIYMFYCLLLSLGENTKLIIVGDYEQLPSVGAGLILRDLVSSKAIPTTILTETFRQSKVSQIAINSFKLIKGIKTTDKDGISFDENKEEFCFIEKSFSKDIIESIIEKINNLLSQGFDIDDIQVFSFMNNGEIGVAELNRKIQASFNPRGSIQNEVNIAKMRCIRLGDKVMHTVNNYSLGVYNGDVGRVKRIDKDRGILRVVVDYRDKEIIYDSSTVHQLVLAYAITVHKSQGCEFPIVIMPFHSSQKLLLNRNTIYTAWTRAKEKVICIGDIKELNKGIDRIENTIRQSRIIEKLIS